MPSDCPLSCCCSDSPTTNPNQIQLKTMTDINRQNSGGFSSPLLIEQIASSICSCPMPNAKARPKPHHMPHGAARSGSNTPTRAILESPPPVTAVDPENLAPLKLGEDVSPCNYWPSGARDPETLDHRQRVRRWDLSAREPGTARVGPDRSCSRAPLTSSPLSPRTHPERPLHHSTESVTA